LIRLRKEVENSLPALEEAQLAWQAAQEAHQTKEDLASIEEANALQTWNQCTVAIDSVAAVEEELDSIREEAAIMNIMGLGDVVVAEKHLPLAKRKLDIVVRLLLDGAATHGFLDIMSAVDAIQSPDQRKELRWILRNLGLGTMLNQVIVVCPIRKAGFAAETVKDEVDRTVRYLVPNFRSDANQSPAKEMKALRAPLSSGRKRNVTSYSEMELEQRREEVGTPSSAKRRRLFSEEDFDSSQRAIHSPSLRPGAGSLKMAGAPSSCGSTDWPGQDLNVYSAGDDGGSFGSHWNHFVQNSLEGGGLSSPFEAVPIISSSKMNSIMEDDDEE